MAGHASGWIKRPSGKRKGQAVFVSRAALPPGYEMATFRYEIANKTPAAGLALLESYAAKSVQPRGQALGSAPDPVTWDAAATKASVMKAAAVASRAATIKGSDPVAAPSDPTDLQAWYEASSVALNRVEALTELVENTRPDLYEAGAAALSTWNAVGYVTGLLVNAKTPKDQKRFQAAWTAFHAQLNALISEARAAYLDVDGSGATQAAAQAQTAAQLAAGQLDLFSVGAASPKKKSGTKKAVKTS